MIVDGPPLLGIADAHALAQRADGILVVSRLDRSTLEDAIEMNDLLYRLEARARAGRRGRPAIGGYAYAGAATGAGGTSRPPSARVTDS